MTNDAIKHMVNRFLGWKLPENFSPDAGISFKAAFNEHTAHPMKHEPTGTNLFDAAQAEAMVRHMVGQLSLVGNELITERTRQTVAEGWTPEHDDEHCEGDLATAAACYALPAWRRSSYILNRKLIEILWPWDNDWYKPAKSSRGRIKELAKAGALIAAEIDRLQRKEKSP